VLNLPDPATAADSFLLSWEVLGRADGLLLPNLLLLATFFPAEAAAAACAGDSGGAGCMTNRPSAPVSYPKLWCRAGMLGGVDISTSCVLDPAAAAAAAGLFPAGTRTAQAAARAALGVWLGLCLHDAVCHNGLCLTHFGLVWYAPGLQKGTLNSVTANDSMALYLP